MPRCASSGAIAIGYRESSIPFSYLSPRSEPIGYSIELCKLLVEAIERGGRHATLAIKWVPVTSEIAHRRGRVAARSTSNAARPPATSSARSASRFSPTIFVSGTKLLVKKGSPIKSFRDLAGKTVVVTARHHQREGDARPGGEVQARPRRSWSARDHAESFAQLTAGQADAFATDDVLLYGLIAQNNARRRDYVVVGEFLSYDPYGIMFRKGDPQLAQRGERHLPRAGRGRRDRAPVQALVPAQAAGSGVSLDLPMSPQLETIIQTMAIRAE